MTRTRALAASILLAGLATPPATTAGAAAPAGPAPAVRAFVAYGDKAVTVPEDHRGIIEFRGRRGDVVSLSGVSYSQFRLLDAGASVPATWEDSGLFRLSHTGRFEFRVRASHSLAHRVRLLKARIHDLEVDGRPLRTPRSRRGYIDLAAVRLEKGDRITVDDGRFGQRLYLPGGRYASLWGTLLMLKTGATIRTSDKGSSREAAVAGKTLIRVRSGHRVTAASSVEVRATPGGDPVTLTAGRTAAREYALTFDAEADDLVYLEGVEGTSPSSGTSVLDRWGLQISSTLNVAPGAPSWVVRAAGPQELSIVTPAARTGPVLRLRQGVQVAALTPDGAAVDFPVDGSGTLVYSLASGDGGRLESTSTGLGSTRWSLLLGPRAVASCGPEPGGPLGCGETPTIWISDTRSSADASFFDVVSNGIAVLAPEPGAAGTISVRMLGRQPAP